MKLASPLKKIQDNWKAGIAVSLVSLPLAVTLAVASHASPVQGVITAIWAGLIASLFGGSNYNIIGPTGALSGLLATYAITHGQATLPMLAIMAGIIIFIAYLFHLETYLIFVPSSTIHGFVLGVALIIIFSQLNFALALTNLPQHPHFIYNVFESCRHIASASLSAVALFSGSLVLLLILMKKIPHIPGAIIISPIGILIGYLSSSNLIPLHIQTLESKFADLSPQLFIMPSLSFAPALLLPSITIAIIAILETIISGRIADGITKTKHNANKELLGLSLANIGSGLAGGIPATAALARTTLNIRSGCTDKMAASISSISIIIISLLLLTYFKYMPLALIASILTVVGLRMIETKHFIKLFESDKINFAIACIVAIITVFADPIVGILFGVATSMILFMKALSAGQYELKDHNKTTTVPAIADTDSIIYSFKGSLAYINAQAHLARFEQQMPKHKKIIFDLSNIYFIDQDGIDAFAEIVDLLKRQKKSVQIIGAHTTHPLQKIVSLHQTEKVEQARNS